MLSKDKLVFDESDVDSSDQVGAHILGSADAKVTSTTDGAREALDVNDSLVKAAVESVDAELVLVNAELDSQTALLTTIDASLDVIEAIDFATETTLAGIKAVTDQLTITGGRLEVLADIRLESDVADDAADTENPFKMGSRAVDGALTAISASGDKANVVSDMYRRIYVNDAPNVGFKVSAEVVGLAAAELVATPLAGRVRIMIQNLGNKDVFIGFSNAVSTANGLRVAAGAFLEMPFGEDLDIWAISTAIGQDVRVVEIA